MEEHSEKRRLEIAAVQIFLQHYNRLRKTNYRLLSMQERPDAVVIDTSHRKMGIEVAHLFYGPNEAKVLLGRYDLDNLRSIQSLQHLLQELQRILDRKFAKGQTYEFNHPMLLVIRSASPVFHGEELAPVITQLSVTSGVFQEIWLLARDEEEPGWPFLIQIA